MTSANSLCFSMTARYLFTHLMATTIHFEFHFSAEISRTIMRIVTCIYLPLEMKYIGSISRKGYSKSLLR